jgi:4-hydroxyphenylpyruvate dioxygenase
VEALAARGVAFAEAPPATYYENLAQRLPHHREPTGRMQALGILADGSGGSEAQAGGLLLQIFTTPRIGPIFFEIIQRKGDEGFGEGNFQALFESMERDQIRRGVLQP